MNTVIVLDHPDEASLTHEVVRELNDRLAPSIDIIDLHGEGFDPRFSPNDRSHFHDEEPVMPAIAAQHARLNDADHLVLVFPVFWWSVPGTLKGWLDRVFVNDWAYDYGADGELIPKLDRLTVHLLPIAGVSADVFTRHGYDRALHTQLTHGIFEFCGAKAGVTSFIHSSECGDEQTIANSIRSATDVVRDAILGTQP